MHFRRLAQLAVCLVPLAAPSSARAADAPVDELAFVPNRGQWPAAVVGYAEAGPVAVWCERDGLLLDLREPVAVEDGAPTPRARGVALRLRFVGARADAAVRGEGRALGERHFLLGADPSRWTTHVPASARLRWTSLYDGVDLRARGAGGALEYDLLVADGADLDGVVVQVEGADAVTLREDGSLVLSTALGEVVQRPPVLFALDAGGAREPLACRVEALGGARFAFRAPEAAGRRLVLDPVLEWGTFVGGAHSDAALDLRVAGDGSLVVVGASQASDYPVEAGAYDVAWNGGKDVVVSRLSPDGGTLLASTYLGGVEDDEARALALLPDGALALAGWTASPDFPRGPGAYDATFGGGSGVLACDAFVAVLEPDGDALRAGTFLGAAGDDVAFDLQPRDDGAFVVAGKTSSPAFPTTGGAFDAGYGGGSADGGDVFVAVVSSDGAQLVASTLLGGASDEIANALLLDDLGRPTVVGWTSSADFPVTADALVATPQGGSDGFVATLTPQLDALVSSTRLGGTSDDNLLGVARDPDGRLVVVGSTRSPGLAVTSGAGNQAYAGGAFFGDGLCARFSVERDGLDLLAYLGGANDDVLSAVARAPDGSLVLAGWTSSPDAPLAGAPLSPASGGTNDGLLLRLAPDGDLLLLGSTLGGLATDKISALALLPDGRVALCGTTTSAGFPVTGGAFDVTFGGVAGLVGDGFLACVDVDVPAASGVFVDLGFALPGASAPRLAASGAPADGGALALSDAPVASPGLLALGLDGGGVPLFGGTFVPFPYLVLAPFASDATGALDVPFAAVAAGSGPLALCVQAWLVDPGGPAGWCASNALAVQLP